jgi:hypothetical protein
VRWVITTAFCAVLALLLGLAASALIAVLRSGGFTDEIGTVLLVVGAVMAVGGLFGLAPNTRSERPGDWLELRVRASLSSISIGLLLAAIGVVSAGVLVSNASTAAKEAEKAKPYKLVIDESAADAAQRAGVDLERLLARTTEKVFALVPHPEQVRILVRLDPGATVPEIGVGAAPGPGRGEILIALNDNPKVGFHRSLTTWLPASLARILFLNSRIQAAPSALGQTLGDVLVSEGLSDHFVAEAFPTTPPQPWDHRPMTARQESRIWKRAKRDLIIPGSYDYSDWFLGTGTSTALPRWWGYTFAYKMVRPYLAAGMTASRAVTIDAESVYAPYAQAHK